MSVPFGRLCFLVFVAVVVISRHEVVGDGITIALPGQFPNQVSLQSNNHHFCGGSIISSNFGLTAAHCVYGKTPNTITAVVGTNLLQSSDSTKNGTKYNVVQNIVHPDFDPQTFANDVALLRVDGEISFAPIYINILGVKVLFGQPVAPVSLSTVNPAPGTFLTLSGWGLTSGPGAIPNILQFIDLEVLDSQTCESSLSGTHPIADGTFCASPVGGSVCPGEAGGPLLTDGEQFAITSWVPCVSGAPTVFTSVAYHHSWIMANTN